MRNTTRNSRGVTTTQYAILIAFLAIALLVGVTVYGNDVKALFFGSSKSIRGVPTAEGAVVPSKDHRHHLGDLGSEDAGDAGAGGGPAAGGAGTSAQVDHEPEQGPDAAPADGHPPLEGAAKSAERRSGPLASPISEPVGPSALDRTILTGLQALLGPPTPNESRFVKAEGKVAFSFPGAEVGLPGSIAVGGGTDVKLERKPDGTYELTYGLSGKAGINETAGAAEISITAGGKDYGLGAEVGVGGGVTDAGEITLAFDPGKPGDMTALAAALALPGGSTIAAAADPRRVTKIAGNVGLFVEGEADVNVGLELLKLGGSAVATTGVEYSRNADGSFRRTQSAKVELQGDFVAPGVSETELTQGEGGSLAVELKVVTDDKVKDLKSLLLAGTGQQPYKSLELTVEQGASEDHFLYRESHKEKISLRIDDPTNLPPPVQAKLRQFIDQPSSNNLQSLTDSLVENGAKISREREDVNTVSAGVSGIVGLISQEIGLGGGLTGSSGRTRKVE